MFCPNCGANVPDNQAFCTTCGASMTPAAAPRQQAPRQQAPRQQAVSVKNLLSKDALAKDSLLIFRIAIIALAVLSIILIFSKGMAIHHKSDSSSFIIYEWDTFFKTCDGSVAFPITFQILSVVFVVGAAASVVVSYFMPQLSKINVYNLIPVIVAAVNLLLYIIMLIVAMVSFEDIIGSSGGAHPASASWFYIADMIAIIVASVKMNKASKK